ncbi:MAG: PAS domain S-box protein [Deltaproteobacteria bacterium]|nr:PAS domain S-box protein [Deltaproteobacteria bacterium]
MKKLIDLVAAHEEWLQNRVMDYVRQHGDTRGTAGLPEDWPPTASELSRLLLIHLNAINDIPELNSDNNFDYDPMAEFCRTETRMHRGVTLGAWFGLFKYVRQSYVDLVRQAGFEPSDLDRCLDRLNRAFDRMEVGFCSAWPGTSSSESEWGKERPETARITADAESAPRLVDGTDSHADTRAGGGDGTLRKRAEESLHRDRRTLRLYERAVESSGDLIAILDNHYVYHMANSAYLKYLGRRKDQVIGHTISEVLGPEIESTVKPNLDACLQGKEVVYEAVRDIGKLGKRQLQVSYSPLREKDGRAVGALAVIKDMTSQRDLDREREFAVKLLRFVNSTNLLQELVGGVAELFTEFSGCRAVGVRLEDDEDFPYFHTQGMPEAFRKYQHGLGIRNRDGRLRRDPDGNPILDCMCGNVIRGRQDVHPFFFTDNGTFWTNNLPDIMASNGQSSREVWTRNCCSNGGYHSMALIPLKTGEKTFGLLQLGDPRPLMFTTPIISFLERMADNLAARLSRIFAQRELNLLSEAINQSDQSVVITNALGNIHYVNSVFLTLFGHSREEVMNRDFFSMINRDQSDQSFYQSARDAGIKGETWKERLQFIEPDGETVELATSVSPVKDEAGTIANFVALMRDVTNEVQMEKHLRQAQKMDSIGTLAGGIAHDFNNILGAIIGYAEMARDDARVGEVDPVNLDEVLRASQRARELVRQILTFSRQAEQEKHPIRVSLIVKESLKLLRASLPTTIEIKQEITDSEAVVMADPTQVHQVMLNLCTNALHAMPDGGVLGVKLLAANIDQKFLTRFPGLKPGPYLKLVVSDTGTGMNQETLDKIFDPFFTTKKKGEGTGLGLSVVHGIIKAHGGAVDVKSEAGKGTNVVIMLPKIQKEILQTGEPIETVPTGSGTILLVDDEAILTKVGKQMLQRQGFQVVTCNSSIEALEIFRRRPDIFDLIITDQTMPGLTGLDLTREVLTIRPAMPIIICTGFSGRVSAETAKAAGAKEFILKPLRKKELVEAINRALNSN